MTESAALAQSNPPLNPLQAEAVHHTEGPMLVAAGPGSGKTRVITHRVVKIMQEGRTNPRQIMAVTFTNRAAREMLTRVRAMTKKEEPEPEIRTFHSWGARFLRREGEAVGLPRTYSIFDGEDQLKAIKACLKDLGITGVRPRDVLKAISDAKSTLVTLEDAEKNWERLQREYYSSNDEMKAYDLENTEIIDDEIFIAAYRAYETLLKKNWAADFDDLILLPAIILGTNEVTRRQYQDTYRYVMVDECQDINPAQYQLADLLVREHRNICMVGDPDQAIYSWRCATPENIDKFLSDYSDARIVALGENYRSTKRIVTATKNLISRNRRRVPNELFTNNGDGETPEIRHVKTEDEEAEAIAEEISRMRNEGGLLAQNAVLYRTNAASRPLEEAFNRIGIRYKILGGTHFYRRREVKDILAYLQVMQNAADENSLDRIMNVPARGVGEKSKALLARWASERGRTLYEASVAVATKTGQPPNLPAAAIRGITSLVTLIERLKENLDTNSLGEIVWTIIDKTGMSDHVQKGDKAEERWENVMSLYRTITERAPGPARNTVETFLEDAGLTAQVEEDGSPGDAATLSTIHQSKGLEFDNVFLIGLEEDNLPHKRAKQSPEELEEERRLCYVAGTRARKNLFLSRAVEGRGYNFNSDREWNWNSKPSRFIYEMLPEGERE